MKCKNCGAEYREGDNYCPKCGTKVAERTNAGHFNSGYYNSGYHNSGHFNSGYFNSGHFNSGYYNSGYHNSGNRNSGDYNSGHRNSGDYNSGDFNSGDYNKTNFSNGIFCNKEPKICIFNIPTDFTYSEFIETEYYRTLRSVSFPLTEWVEDDTKPEGGYLLKRTYEEACGIWWDTMTDENKAIIKSMPNFDVDVFCDITGIEKDKV